MHYYQHSIGDYRRDTMHLTLLEHGVYRQLLDLYYLNECELDANALRLICARDADEVRAAESVLKEFFIETEKGWKHTRCSKEIAKFKEKSEKAKASADARWKPKSNSKNANAMRTHSEGNANHKPITNNHKPLKDITPRAMLEAESIPKKLIDEWLQIRKSKKAILTESALTATKREAEKANLTLIQAIQICCEKSWAGFDSKYLSNKSKSFSNPREEGRQIAAKSIFKPKQNLNQEYEVQDAKAITN